MTCHILGTLIGMDDDGRIEVLPASGVGYAFHVNDRDREAINVRGVGSELRLHTRERANENEVVRYGFLSFEDRRAFDRILAIDGIGPGLALKVLSVLSAERFIAVVRAKDTAALTKIPGIGAKKATSLCEVRV